MKKIFLFLTIFLMAWLARSQDIDFFLRNKNDNYKMPQIPEEMTFNEYYLLSQTFRMQDMLYATVVPGYIHLKAQENKTAYTLIGLRAIASGALGYEYFKLKQQTGNLTLTQFLLYGGQNQLLTRLDRGIIGAAIITATATYLFDIIHGKYILEKKQEKIRFKYSPRISFYPIGTGNIRGYGIGLAIYL